MYRICICLPFLFAGLFQVSSAFIAQKILPSGGSGRWFPDGVRGDYRRADESVFGPHLPGPLCSTAQKFSEHQSVVTKFKRLQNQSDIRGISLPGVPGEEVTLSTRETYCIGQAFATWVLRNRGCNGANGNKVRVSVGRDPRLSGPDLAEALMGGITANGMQCEVADCGLSTTPAMFKTCVTPGYMYDGAVMITASHLPSNRNGLKFFTKKGGLNQDKIAQVVALAADAYGDGDFTVKGPSPELTTKLDFLPVYVQQLKDMICSKVNLKGTDYWTPLKGFHVVVNAGNGMGGFMVEMLEELGANTTGSLHLKPDGTFPNHLANPELPEAMEPTIASVRANEADLGIVLDTDVDRSGVVDHRGASINRNRLVALMSAIVLRDYPGTTIVTDSTTSNGLKRFIEARDGFHLRFQKGYKNVIDKAVELNTQGVDAQLAIETSGHGAFKDNQMLDDGAYLSLKVLVEMACQGKGKDLSDTIQGLEEPKEEVEFRLKVSSGLDTKSMYEKTLTALESAERQVSNWTAEAENYEGLRVIVDEGNGRAGWIMNRMSLHDPIIIFNVESEVEGGIAIIAKNLLEEVLKTFDEDLDLSPLHNWINLSHR